MACLYVYRRYHYLHSGDHGDAGMNMLNDGTHPPFLDRSGSGDRHLHHSQQHNSNTRHGSSSQETSTESEEVSCILLLAIVCPIY
jgi:hypothetical protein